MLKLNVTQSPSSIRGVAGSDTESASENLNSSKTETATEGSATTVSATEGECSDIETVHSEESSTYTIRKVHNPVNCFKNQIILSEGRSKSVSTEEIFDKQFRHFIVFGQIQDIYVFLKKIINPNVINCLHCELHILGKVQNEILKIFPSVKFVYADKIVIDVKNPNDQDEIITSEHSRAHRNYKENANQILENYYFPQVRNRVKAVALMCKICKEAKYTRHPKKTEIGKTPIPTHPGELLHIDIFSTDQKHFLTCIDKFTKFAITIPIPSRSIVDIKGPLLEILNFFPNATTIICDNEKSLNSETIKSLAINFFGVTIYAVPPNHSVSNGQVERFHNTLGEIARCLKLEKGISDVKELIALSTNAYNQTVHSVTGFRPTDLVHQISDDVRENVSLKIKEAQDIELQTHCRKRTIKTYQPGDIVFLKTNRRCGNKLSKLAIEKRVQKDIGTKVLIDNRIVHKDNLR